MERKTFERAINIAFLILLGMGLYFTSVYFKYVFIKQLSLIKEVALWCIELGWAALVTIGWIKRGKIFEKRKELALSLGAVIIGLIIIEIVLRVMGAAPPIYSPHPYLNYYGTPNYQSLDGLNVHNSMGYRGPEIQMPKPEGVMRIIITGGSSTYETGIKDWHKDSARQLEKQLREQYHTEKIEVINAGLGGWDSWEGLIDLELRVLELQPDLIILYHGVNDVHSRLVNPAYYKSDNTGRRKQWENKACGSLFCLKLVQVISGITTSQFDVDAPTWGPSDTKILGMSQDEVLEKNKPVYFERNMQDMITLIKERNVSVMVVTWAHSNQLGDYASYPYYEKAFAEQNEMLKELGRKNNVPVYDYASEMPIDKKYWVDGRHVSELGAEIKGKLYAQFIIKNRLINP